MSGIIRFVLPIALAAVACARSAPSEPAAEMSEYGSIGEGAKAAVVVSVYGPAATANPSISFFANIKGSAPAPVTAYCFVEGKAANTTCPDASWVTLDPPVASTTRNLRLSLSRGDGVKVVRVFARNGAGAIAKAPLTVVLDTQVPTEGSVTVTPLPGALVVKPKTYSDGAGGSGVAGYVVVAGEVEAPPDCSGQPLDCSGSPNLTCGNLVPLQAYNLRVCAVDKAGNMTAGKVVSGTPAAYPPGISATVIVDGKPLDTLPWVRSNVVDLRLRADAGNNGEQTSDLTQYCVKEVIGRGTPASCVDGEWLPLAATGRSVVQDHAGFQLSTGEGLKKVGVWFRDSGNTVSPLYTLELKVDTVVPTQGAITKVDNASTRKLARTLVFSVAGLGDGRGSGLRKKPRIVLSETDADPEKGCTGPLLGSCAATELKKGATTVTCSELDPGAKATLRVCAVDLAGNVADGVVYSDIPTSGDGTSVPTVAVTWKTGGRTVQAPPPNRNFWSADPAVTALVSATGPGSRIKALCALPGEKTAAAKACGDTATAGCLPCTWSDLPEQAVSVQNVELPVTLNSDADGMKGIWVYAKDEFGAVGAGWGSIGLDQQQPEDGVFSVLNGASSVVLSFEKGNGDWDNSTLAPFAGYTVKVSEYVTPDPGATPVPPSCDGGVLMPAASGIGKLTVPGLTVGKQYAVVVCASDILGRLSDPATGTAMAVATTTAPRITQLFLNGQGPKGRGGGANNGQLARFSLSAAGAMLPPSRTPTVKVTAWCASEPPPPPKQTPGQKPPPATKVTTCTGTWTNFDPASPTPTSVPIPFMLSDAEFTAQKPKFVYFWVRDEWMNVSTPMTFTITTSDIVAPTDGTVTVAGFDAQSVSLYGSGFADNATGVGLSLYRVVGSTTDTAPADCSGPSLCDLPSNALVAAPPPPAPGVRPSGARPAVCGGLAYGTAYKMRLCAMDNAGNLSPGVTFDVITKTPTTPPVLAGVWGAQSTRSPQTPLSLRLTGSSPDGVRLSGYCIKDQDTVWFTPPPGTPGVKPGSVPRPQVQVPTDPIAKEDCAWTSFSFVDQFGRQANRAMVPYGTYNYTLTATSDGKKTVTGWLIDEADHVSAPRSFVVFVDTTRPVDGEFSFLSGNSGQLTLGMTKPATDVDGTGVAAYTLAVNADGTAPETCAAAGALVGACVVPNALDADGNYVPATSLLCTDPTHGIAKSALVCANDGVGNVSTGYGFSLPPAPSESKAGALTTVNLKKVPFEFSYIPSRVLTVGDGGWEHLVKLSKPYLMARTETTQRQWKAVTGVYSTAYDPDADDDSVPVGDATWAQAAAFCDSMSQLAGKPKGYYRLPTEAEWENAARADTSGATYRQPVDIGWFADLGDPPPSTWKPVGEKTANPWNLYDVFGNAGEWTSDFYYDYDMSTPTVPLLDPVGPPAGDYRIYRGGTLFLGSWSASVTARFYNDTINDPSVQDIAGFRVVRPVQ